MLEALGVAVDLGPEEVARCIDEVGFGFMFAPRHPSATSHVRPAREGLGVRTHSCDLADGAQVAALPTAANVLFLAGQKFGTDSAPGQTWIQNTYVPALVAQRFRDAHLVIFSTGCVYPFVPVTGPGANEREPVAFIGEYASTCVGRERVFSHYAAEFGTRQLMYRLNYSVELRYGVLVDIALKVFRGACWFSIRCSMFDGQGEQSPLNPEHHLTPTLSPTSWRRGRRTARGSFAVLDFIRGSMFDVQSSMFPPC